MYKTTISLLLFVFSLSLPAFSYVIKKDDTLRSIVKSNYKGSVEAGMTELLKSNKNIQDPDNLQPGMIIKLNKKLLKAGLTDDVAQTEDEAIDTEVDYDAESEADSDSAQGLNPYIEVEKYNANDSKALKAEAEDKISFFLNFRFNNLAAKNRASLNAFNFNTASETDVGFEYTKNYSPTTNFFLILAVNEFALPEVTTTTPMIDKSGKVQPTCAIGGRYLYTQDNYIGYSLNYFPHYYLTESTPGRVVLEHIPSTSVSFDTEYQFFNNTEFVIGLNLGIEYITTPLNTGNGSPNGLGFNFGFLYQQEFKSFDKLRVKFNFNQTNIDTSVYNLIDNSLSISFLYSLPY